MALALSVLPLLLIVATGYGAAKSGLISPEGWRAIETLSFKILIPATLVLAISGSDLSIERFGGFSIALFGTFTVIALLVLALRFLISERALSNPTYTSVFQSTVRWNAFVALAAAEQFLTDGLSILAVAIAVLVPAINVICIVVLAAFGPSKVSAGAIANTVIRNPLIQACGLGLALNLGGISLPTTLTQTLDMIGRAALGVGLMTVGAGISLRRLKKVNRWISLAVLLRPLVVPILFVCIAMLMALPPVQIFAGVLVFAAPTASNGYIIARKMGGDADIYADIMTWQAILSLLVYPFWALVLL